MLGQHPFGTGGGGGGERQQSGADQQGKYGAREPGGVEVGGLGRDMLLAIGASGWQRGGGCWRDSRGIDILRLGWPREG